MSEITPTPDTLRSAVYTARFAALARADVDLGTWATWDRRLPRNTRILVPLDVQAFVVPAQHGEATVRVGGVMDDPEPFADGVVRPTGVHLHWALPDALLRGEDVEDDAGAHHLRMTPLPDRWVVVRTVLPEGATAAYATGWVVDAVHGVVIPLATWSGGVPPEVLAAGDAPVLDPLDAAARGTLLWTATYEGAVHRFTLHDGLEDLAGLEGLAPRGLHGGRAVYTVAGWWSAAGQDPLAGAAGSTALRRRLTELGWEVTNDGQDELEDEDDPYVSTLETYAGLTSPPTTTKVTTTTQHATTQVRRSNVAQYAALPVEEVSEVIQGIAVQRYHTLLHGSVLGVPVDGSDSGSDDRPDPGQVSGSLGLDVDDIAAALALPGIGTRVAERSAAERLCAAFTGDLLSRISTSDGLADLEEREHSDGFWGMPGPPLPGAHADRLRTEDSAPLGPSHVGRKGRADARETPGLRTKTRWKTGVVPLAATGGAADGPKRSDATEEDDRARRGDAPASRDVVRAAPRLFRPAPVMVGLRGVRPSLRHHGDRAFDDGMLRCRYPGEVVTGIQGVVDAATILPTLGNGALPPEVLGLVREAVVLDGYSWRWLVEAARRPDVDVEALTHRVEAEMVRLYGTYGRYDPSGVAAVSGAGEDGGPRVDGDGWQRYGGPMTQVHAGIASEMARFALVAGTPPSPVALTTWRQPWLPLFLEWQVRLEGSAHLAGWELIGTDLTRPDPTGAPPEPAVTRTVTGRSPVNAGVATALTTAIDRWLVEEAARDATVPSTSQLSDADEAALDRLADLLRPLDVVSASLDGIREGLLGIPYSGLVVRPAASDGSAKPPATGLPVPLFGGTLTVERLRVVDAFGRVLEVPAVGLVTTTTLEVAGQPSTVRLAPRVQHAARWLLRLVDPGYPLADDPAHAPEAYVDQLRAALAVSPVSGFLLPDHVDEALEVFDRDGNPLGQVMHDSVTDAVTWETAPGRPLPPDAGPLAGIPAHAQHAALVAAGLIRNDVDTRHGATAAASSLSTLLRAIDSTLWGVDTFAALGSPTVAGLVGRPVAVVRATLRLETPDDVDEVQVTAPGGAPARRAAFAALAEELVPVRIGELGRSDDAVLGFFVDDDYTRFHVVDRVVASAALAGGRHTGHLGLLGGVPEPDPIVHPYLELEDTLLVRPGRTVRLTVLMLPAGKMHLTSGILPRKAVELADTWVTPGLVRVVPSLRIGPVLVDPAEIRLPNVASLGGGGVFTRRTGPLTWRDDPILASTTNAYLPPVPHEVQEGWIRVDPETSPEVGP